MIASSLRETSVPLSHLDRALAEEFSGHETTIRHLKTANAHFRDLMLRNHALWAEIQSIQNGLEPSSAHHLAQLEKKRLKLLDELAGMVAAAE